MRICLRGLRFLRRYVFVNPKYTFAYLLFFWQKDFSFKAHLLSKEEFTNLLKNGKSLIRFGDGEINLMLGLRNHYQEFSPVLQKVMFEIVESYNQDSSYILSVPKFINCKNSELKTMDKLYVWLPLKIMFRLYFNKKEPYLDAHAFYYDGFLENTVGHVIRDKHIFIITKEETINKQRSNPRIPWRQVDYISTPSESSLDSFDGIREKVLEAIKKYNKTDIVLLFALGPVGKKLIFELSKEGIQSLDIGRGIETMYTDESIAHLI